MTDTFTEVRARLQALVDQKDANRAKPTIAELEVILASPWPNPVSILPNGEITTGQWIEDLRFLFTHIDAQAERIRELEVENMRLKSNRAPTGAGWFG